MNAKKSRKVKNGFSNIGAFIISLLAICVFTGVIICGYILINVLAVTNGQAVLNLDTEQKAQNQTSFIYVKDPDAKEEKYIEYLRLHGTENRIWVDYEKIPKCMKDAFIALEDRRFETHKGVDWIRTVGVIVKPSYKGQGGSTITQQLVKNITGNNEVTFVRKYNEILTALNLEKNYSKDEILVSYLNTVYLGQGCYGVETAAETYFGKTALELNYAECACIAAITKAPYSLDPINNRESNRERMVQCLDYMLDQGKIDKKTYDEALNYHITLTTDDDYVPSEAELERRRQQKEAKNNNEFESFYIDFVIDQLINKFLENGDSYKEATGKIYGGGLKIYTAVDLNVQKKLEDIYVNKTNWLDRAAQSACTVMDYNGRVVAIVGQAGEKEGNRVLNRASDSPRQPGSSIKPLAVYGPGINEGEITWSTLIKDYALTINGSLWPHNASGDAGSGGSVTVQNALSRSLNTVSARVCVDVLGTETCYDYLKNHFHLSTLVDDYDNNPAPLCVGAMTQGVTSLEMTAAYAAFGNGGMYYEPYSYFRVENSAGEVIFDNENPTGERALSTDSADVMRHLLETVTTRYYATGSEYKVSGFDTFAKTGTTDDNYDKWFVGGTPYYVAAVWYGYDIPETIYAYGNPAGTIFKTVMDDIHEDLPDKDFEDTGDVVQLPYCTYTGLLASRGCYATDYGWYRSDTLPAYCSGHYYSSSSDSDDEEKDAEDDDTGAEDTGAEDTGTEEPAADGGSEAEE